MRKKILIKNDSGLGNAIAHKKLNIIVSNYKNNIVSKKMEYKISLNRQQLQSLRIALYFANDFLDYNDSVEGIFLQSVDGLTASRIDDDESYLAIDSKDHYWDDFRITEQIKHLKIQDSDDYDWGAFHSDAPELLEKFAQLINGNNS